MTHDRPIHKTTGVPGPAQGAGLSLSPQPEGSRYCWGWGATSPDCLEVGWGPVLFVKRGKIYFFLKNKSQSLVVSVPCLNSSIAKAHLQTVEFCKPFALFRRETRPSPGACVFICPFWQSGACCGLDPSLFSDLGGSIARN